MMPSGRRLPPPPAAPEAVSRVAAAPLSAPRRRGPAVPPPVPRAGLLPPSPGAAPTSGGPCQLQQRDKSPKRGRDSGHRDAEASRSHSRAQPALRLRVAQLIWIHELKP
ncbi:formin-like protein 7 [Sciurus carolinensis]|uniref:formin-like protein 7 n=1 Tax=Sciurus carolinensis TaxID=30640 RepID=UPI001FB2C41D|nr:formin-like protein 7 [Sciurus carolinensis]